VFEIRRIEIHCIEIHAIEIHATAWAVGRQSCDRPATLTGMLFLEAIRWEKLALSFWKGLLAILSKPTPEKPPRLDRVLTGCPGQKVDFLMQP